MFAHYLHNDIPQSNNYLNSDCGRGYATEITRRIICSSDQVCAMDIDHKPGNPEGETLVLFVYLIAIIGSMGMIAWQIIDTVVDGKVLWLSLITVLEWVDVDWATTPGSWEVLHSFLNRIPLAPGYFVVVGGIGWIMERSILDRERSIIN